ncbi:MAG: hypothetical protein D6798_01475 [Deltaproteobacteria bacterium]|nr:MAG: hypothetical protein D6798_01475 [Deltaproteobacteria bacterium]
MHAALSLMSVALFGCTSPQADGATSPVADLAVRLHPDFPTLIEVSWEQLDDAEGHVEYAVEGEDWQAAPSSTLSAGPQERRVAGVPFETPVTVRVVSDGGGAAWESAEVAITTGSPPADLPLPTLLVADDGRAEPTGRFLYASLFQYSPPLYGASWLIIVDRRGRLVWAMESPLDAQTFYVRQSRDGTALMWDETRLFDPEASQVHRMKLDGTEEATWPTPAILHAWTELPDESIVWGSYADGTFEKLVELSADGSRRELWDCREFEEAHGSPHTGCLSNSLYWDAATDSFLYSFFTSMTVVQVDHQTGETLESWGQLSDWTFDPPESQFDWQHGVTWTDRGTMLLSTHVSPESDEVVVREYELDSDARVLRQVWSFGEGEGITAENYGEARRLPGGNTLQNTGTTPRVREISPEGDVVWDVAWLDDAGRPADVVIGRSIWLADLYAFLP